MISDSNDFYMAGGFWRIRGKHEDFDPYTIYGIGSAKFFSNKGSLLSIWFGAANWFVSVEVGQVDTPKFFTLRIHHRGQFTKSPNREYVNGKITFIDMVDYEDFRIKVLNAMIHRIGYPNDMVFYYFFKIPYVCLDLGLNMLSSNSDFKSLCAHVQGGAKQTEVYVEHCHSNILIMSLDVDDPSSPINAIGNGTEVSESDDYDEDDPDYIEDEDNLVVDIEVDMLHFRSCVDFDEKNQDDDCSENDSAEENDIKVDPENFDSNSDNDLESTTLKKVHKRVIRKN
ncbi:hypothetical protein R6Q59_028501 [Mikania micrantha]